MEINPLSIILIKSDSKGDRMLFRYPHTTNHQRDSSQWQKKKNPYSIIIAEDSLQSLSITNQSNENPNERFSDKVLSTLFAVKPELCESKFELKVNDVRFVGHPTLLPSRGPKEVNSSMLFHVVFALQAQANYAVVKCYYDLSRRLGITLRHEEKRCRFLSEEIKIMVSAHDEVAARFEEESECDESPYETILQKSSLAKNLKSIFESLTTSGIINVMINKWIPVSFCLPQKVHQSYKKGFVVDPEIINKCLDNLKPYHGLLLLADKEDLLKSLPTDHSPALYRLIQMYNPLKSLQVLAADSDLTLSQVFQLTGHLIYWAKATIIYPLCTSNSYVVSPDAVLTSQMLEAFSKEFPGMCLLQVISEFSLPTSISQKLNPLHEPQREAELSKIIIWLLKNHLLLQLHTYVQYMPTVHGNVTFINKDCVNDLSAPNDVQHNGSVGVMDSSSGSFTETSKASVDSEKDINLGNSDKIFSYESDDYLTEDMILLNKLCRLGYFKGSHHLEEIMYLENIRRSQLLQILDKYRDVLITCESEDPAMALFYS